MKKALLAAATALTITSAWAGDYSPVPLDPTLAAKVKRDVCMSPGYAWAFGTKPDRYLNCLRLGETSILAVLDAGYRVTAAMASPQMGETSTVVFIEKAE
ncbi:hypothetical protein Hthe01_18830 [Hydrogenophilus thermoluteolus]|uniref:hypothetical protein n=1 Tax=Hydrogenophilus thermoluteolus TaxID=297 RepID=UPI00249FBBBF|nr:hypothetical protein [Hydrogenophilus thermoluteolus]GLW61534.1 hypothetical protein Hthe01_18830 [Hydrogenophilus thermoluteolus]